MKKITPGHLIVYPLLLILISLIFKDQLVAALADNNGFDLSDSLINVTEIHHGGPAKDGIPAIDNPVFILAKQAGYLANEDHVLGLSINGIAKAYPIKILNYHEIVNDFFLQKAVAITYCPLCGSGIGYSANIKGKNTTFGVSGLLYNSDVLLYDRETESLWSQLLSKAISGGRKGTELEMLPLNHTTWRAWKQQYPDTLVLSDKTGFSRNYSRNPYGNYDKSQSLYFPVKQLNRDYHPKEYVMGLKLSGKTKVYPFAELSKVKSPYKDTFSGNEVTIVFDTKNRTGKILDVSENEIPTVASFWFAWMAFYPESEVFKAEDQ
ncbi:MAG: DUF3179 domain-containing protein [gamma proteobacterium symbiont of Bathyaustriella thionipta]|nr:DUF3179 domain-containing protein [gamma proteobacterium symbiont of Bathyaustriella thionipta]MCU7950154.1 DUF3179 domain-containing protein [gamma proteobacterium symbiont of Bathyaustriella thionipta]MCU7952739.1 DUF3179 domain-containing protein [gamma proteobacterium symbiont of Bathyaustriella thionipta]MCU7957344.1 DUF3179 domain-containing protein [gamma proteobacterium symbiont of Bathyaustriella thionipta]MCU7968978.1 DUF3179 domain-containing protein [gamma proteobacterium symbion